MCIIVSRISEEQVIFQYTGSLMRDEELKSQFWITRKYGISEYVPKVL